MSVATRPAASPQRAWSTAPAPLAEWPLAWRGHWIWDHEPPISQWWDLKPGQSHWAILRKSFDVETVPATLPVRVTCDSRYTLYLNGALVGRGPSREEPEHLSWDEYDLAPLLLRGVNVLVAEAHYYGDPGPWWYPAAPAGTLGRGSFAFETAPGAAVDLATDATWRGVPSPWLPKGAKGMHSFPPEFVDGRRTPEGLHDPQVSDDRWPNAVILSGKGLGTLLDRPPAAPYMDPIRRSIPHLRSVILSPARTVEPGMPVRAELLDDPAVSWATVKASPDGERVARCWDMGKMTLAHVRMTVTAPPGAASGATIDVGVGEDIAPDGLPEIRPRRWVGRYIYGGRGVEEVTFFDPVGLRFVGVHHPAGFQVSVTVEEAIYPRPDGATFTASDDRYSTLWTTGVRTVDLCSSDAFMDCPGREQRAWVCDAYVETLAALVSSPDWRLVRRHLELTGRSRFASGLLAGAAACDFSHIGVVLPEYSLHWIRSVAAYWRASGDADFVRRHLAIADGVIERYERQRGPSGLLEDFPGWVFIDWSQVDRDSVIGAHDALYAAALEDYSMLPGAQDVRPLIARTKAGFEALWDPARGLYVDAIGTRGKSRRLSQQTNAAALFGGLAPHERVAGIIDRITDPAAHGLGKVVQTFTPGAARRKSGATGGEASVIVQYQAPDDFDEERDLVAAQIYYSRFVHEAFFRHGRRDLILSDLLRWDPQPGYGTFGEFWHIAPAAGSRCHGWSASPTFDLTAYILGVRPIEPGYTRTIVDPYLGTLDWVAGRVPTPLGWLDVEVRKDRAHMRVPDGMTVDIGGKSFGSGDHEVTLSS
ncbi:MAG: glycoside hydrolase family 78 protein [Chloroflexota bacterium]|nr:glycoside hydrolase family 78 protein [Chloroflexota bacterium]